MYEKNKKSWLKHLDFLILDIFALSLAFVISYFTRAQMGLGLREDVSYRGFYLLLLAISIFISLSFKGYSDIIRRSYAEEIVAIIKQNVLLLGCILLYLVFSKQSQYYSRLMLGNIFACNFLFMIIFRMIRKKRVRSNLNNTEKSSKVLIVASASNVEEYIQKINNSSYQAFHIVGVVLTDYIDEKKNVSGVPIVADEENMMEYTKLHVVDEVLIVADMESVKVRLLADQFLEMGVVVHVGLSESIDTLPHKQINQMGELTVITSSIQSANMFELFVKRGIDIVGSLVGLLITAVAFLFVAPMIYIKSPGPIFFSQYRMGKNGRRFKIYKFRSMYMDAEKRKQELMEKNEMQGLMFKMENDPRIISGIGHFIRNTSIDELPQFWNILIGDMSLVGTRPPTVDEFEKYELHHKVRLSFRPGLTGMWQVSGRSDITDFEEVVRLDEGYIRNWSIWLDIQIILKTVLVVLQRKGSK